MKICIFGDERSIHTRRWVEGLRSRGFHVDLVTLVKDQSHEIGGISLEAGGKLSYLTKVGHLRSTIKKLNPDIFHAHHASSFGFLASFIEHPAKILSVWGYDVVTFPYRNFINRIIIKRSLKYAHYITATSEYLRESVLKLNEKSGNIEVIPFGIDLGRFRYVERNRTDGITIGIAKSLKPKYGVDVLIRALGILRSKHKDVMLKIAGKGSHEEVYKELSRKLGLEDCVDFLGCVEHSRLPLLLADFDIFAMPSIYDDESFGVAALEASATGLPVVASRVGGVPEVVINNRTGFLVEKKNTEQLAAAIERFIENRDLRLKMGKAGRKLVEEKYDWNANLDSMVNLYEKILAERRK